MTSMNEGESKELILLQTLLERARQDVGADNATIAVPDPDPSFIRVMVSATDSSNVLWRTRFAMREGVAGHVAATKQPLIVYDVDATPEFRRLGQRPIGSIMAVPVDECGKFRGVLTVTSARAHAFTDRSLRAIESTLPATSAAFALAERAAWGVQLASLAHDISTPVSSIRGFLQLLTDRRGSLPRHEITQVLQLLGVAADQLGHLVEEMHDSLSLAGRGLQLDIRQFDVVGALQKTLASLQVLANEAKVRLHFQASDQSVLLRGDCPRISRIVINLVQNAFKFTPEGRQIVVSLERKSPDTISITVEDEGAGIAEDILPRIFDLAFVGMTSERAAGKSHGLGLPIARTLARMHDGDLLASNRPGGGARFELLLPTAGPGFAQGMIAQSAPWLLAASPELDLTVADALYLEAGIR